MLWKRLFSSKNRIDPKWKVTVGLEIHAQLRTKHKLFSYGPNRFGAEANVDLAPFDVALPGSLPVLNKHAIFLALRAALAFDCHVNPVSRFDRKHYFYPDQPAGYQITQNYHALAHNGHLQLLKRDGLEADIRVGISQVQIEQDTARTTYLANPPETLIDLNRNGSPLIEIVTTPSIPSSQAAGITLRKIQAILRAVGASDANMESGGMRCDVNISVTTDDDRHLGSARRTEIKNLASGKIVTAAVEAEFRRQVEVLDAGGCPGRETRGYDVDRQETFLIRKKESTTDYRYMPDADIPAVILEPETIEKCRMMLTELPDAQLDRLLSDPYNLALKDARVLIQDENLYTFYQNILSKVGLDNGYPRLTSNWVVHELLGRQRTMRELGQSPAAIPADDFATLIRALHTKKTNGTMAKSILQEMLNGKADAGHIMISSSASDEDLASILQDIMVKHPQQAKKLSDGDVKIRKWFVGQIMRETRGRADTEEIEKLLMQIANSPST